MKVKASIKSCISFTKSHRVIRFNQNPWLKPFIDMNADLREKTRKVILRNIF